MNIIDGMMMLETNCAPKLASNSSSFLSRNASSTSRAPAEHPHQRVAGERLLDLAVERAGVPPLRDEVLLAALADGRG